MKPKVSSNQYTVLTNSVVLLVLMVLVGFQSAAGQTSGASSSGTVTLPAGTQIMVRTVDAVDSETSQPDQRFRGSLEANLMANGAVVAPKGTPVFGRLINVQSANGRSGGQLEFDLTDIVINGQTHSLATSPHQAQGQGAGSQTGTGARTGAAIGAVTGGVGGAIRGAGAGAVAGKVSAGNAQGEKVKLPAGTLVEFSLENPVSLPVSTK
jgi:hypothetical protein